MNRWMTLLFCAVLFVAVDFLVGEPDFGRVLTSIMSAGNALMAHWALNNE